MLYQRLRRRRHTLSLGRRRVKDRTESDNDEREKLSLQETLQGDEEEDKEGQTSRQVEDEALRLLLIHADKFEYETKEQAVKEPEPLSDHGKKGGLQDGLVVFSTVEKADEESPENTVANAAESIEEVLGWLKTKRVMIYPYAHLSTSLASRDPAIKILKALDQKLADDGYEVSRSPFGWYKGFTITAKGHPLSELSRTITSKQAKQGTAPIKSEYATMDEAGELHSPETFRYRPGQEEFQSLVEKEALKKGLTGGQPRFLEYARRFGIEWESYADVGHMRFGPEADMMIQLLSDYANTVTRRIGIPILNVRGTNMFDVNVQPIKEHLQLFGSRAYELSVDERDFVLRYAACFQQFSMVKDWTLSYRNLPFGTLEVADSYRMEQSGELLLSFRLRKFLMPDLHIYLTNLKQSIDVGKEVHEIIYEEIRKLHREYVSIYNTTRSFFKEKKDLFLDLVKLEKKQKKKQMLPVWISPFHARIIPISKQFIPDAMKLLERLEKEGLRVDLDDRDDTLQSRIREAELGWVPYVVVLGEREIKTGELSVRARGEGKEIKTSADGLTSRIKGEVEGYPMRALTYPKMLSQRPGYKRL